MSTHNINFHGEIRKIFICIPVTSCVMVIFLPFCIFHSLVDRHIIAPEKTFFFQPKNTNISMKTYVVGIH